MNWLALMFGGNADLQGFGQIARITGIVVGLALLAGLLFRCRPPARKCSSQAHVEANFRFPFRSLGHPLLTECDVA